MVESYCKPFSYSHVEFISASNGILKQVQNDGVNTGFNRIFRI